MTAPYGAAYFYHRDTDLILFRSNRWDRNSCENSGSLGKLIYLIKYWPLKQKPAGTQKAELKLVPKGRLELPREYSH